MELIDVVAFRNRDRTNLGRPQFVGSPLIGLPAGLPVTNARDATDEAYFHFINAFKKCVFRERVNRTSSGQSRLINGSIIAL